MSAGVVAGEAVVPADRGQINIYSVVFTEEGGKLGFEMFLLRGEMRRPEQIERDLSGALEWVRRGGLLHSDKGNGDCGEVVGNAV